MSRTSAQPGSQFQVPPGWPTPPAGWTPPKGWVADPSWPPAPEGWVFWRRTGTAVTRLPANAPQLVDSPRRGSVEGDTPPSTWASTSLAQASAVAPIAMETYKVTYRGGHPDLPKSKAGGVRLLLTPEAFVLNPTIGSEKFWKALTIPYADVNSVQIVARVVSTFESLAGGLNSRQLNQDNNIHIDYALGSGNRVLLRLEMLSGVTVMGQAKRCREFEDRLRALGITGKFKQAAAGAPTRAEDSITTKITRLAQLRDQGILTEEEFNVKKVELLARL